MTRLLFFTSLTMMFLVGCGGGKSFDLDQPYELGTGENRPNIDGNLNTHLDGASSKEESKSFDLDQPFELAKDEKRANIDEDLSIQFNGTNSETTEIYITVEKGSSQESIALTDLQATSDTQVTLIFDYHIKITSLSTEGDESLSLIISDPLEGNCDLCPENGNSTISDLKPLPISTLEPGSLCTTCLHSDASDFICSDGSVGGPSGICVVNPDHQCVEQWSGCPDNSLGSDGFIPYCGFPITGMPPNNIGCELFDNEQACTSFRSFNFPHRCQWWTEDYVGPYPP